MFRKALLVVTVLSFCTHQLSAQVIRRAIDSFKIVVDTCHDTVKADNYYHLSQNYVRVSADSCEIYANISLKWAHQFQDSAIIAASNTVLGVVEKNRGNFDKAIKHHLTSLKIMEERGSTHGAAIANNDIGILYKQMKRWDDALVHYKKSNELTKKMNYDRGIAMTYTNIGTIYQHKSMWDTAAIYYDSGYHYALKSKHPNAIASALANIGEVKMEQGKYREALNAFIECLGIDKSNEDQYGMFVSYFQVSRAYAGMKEYDKSIKYIDSAEHIAREEQMTRELIDLLTEKGNIEKDRGHYKDALTYSVEASALKDSIFSEEATQQVTELTTRYETEKKEQQIILQKAELSKKNYIIISIGGLLVLSILLGTLLYNRYRLKQKDKLQQEIITQQELATQAVIVAEERERKRIAGDLHDGVGQTMSAAKMNLSTISKDIPFANEDQRNAFDKAMALVDEGCNEVRTVSHNIMPNALLKTGLATAVRDFLNKIDSKVLKVNLYTDGLNERLHDNTETVLYRVVQECVNNVIKHADANTLDMTLIKDDDGVSITIEDNGNGFDINTAKKKDGIGLQNLRTRISYLKGTIEWDTAPGNGTVVSIHIPEA